MTTIRARDLDLATLERLKRRVVCDERLGDRAGVLHVPSETSATAGAPDDSAPSNLPENPADEFVIHLDAKSLRFFLNALEAWILAGRPPFTDAVDDPRERARRVRETLAGREHSDSGAIQHEDRRR